MNTWSRRMIFPLLASDLMPGGSVVVLAHEAAVSSRRNSSRHWDFLKSL